MIYADIGMDTASLAGTLECKLAAIREAGFAQVMISAGDVVSHPQGTAAGIRTVRESGLRVTGLEALRDFEGLSGNFHAYKVDVAKSMLDVCSSLGGDMLIVEASTSKHADSEDERVVRDLRMLAMLAVPLGIRIAYKAVPHSRVAKDFAAAGELVLRANCHNLGLVIDSFDILAARTALVELEALDPAQIYLAQLSDFVWQEISSVEEQAAAATHFRVFPGDGAHSDDLAAVVRKLDEIDYRGGYSLDVYNDDYLQMPVATVAAQARRAAEWLAEAVLRRALPVPDIERLRQPAGG